MSPTLRIDLLLALRYLCGALLAEAADEERRATRSLDVGGPRPARGRYDLWRMVEDREVVRDFDFAWADARPTARLDIARLSVAETAELVRLHEQVRLASLATDGPIDPELLAQRDALARRCAHAGSEGATSTYRPLPEPGRVAA